LTLLGEALEYFFTATIDYTRQSLDEIEVENRRIAGLTHLRFCPDALLLRWPGDLRARAPPKVIAAESPCPVRVEVEFCSVP
jgi:hypothetical protein